MNVHNLDKIFKPKRIAIIGVSPNPNSVNGKILANLAGSGFRGVVYPISPVEEAVMGISCFPDLKSLPNVPDLAVICTDAKQVPARVKECGEAGVMGVIIISAGFKEAGEEGKKLEEEIKAEQKKFDGMRIIGPNCLGIIVPSLNLNVSFAPCTPHKGNIAFISQSGALCTSVLDWAMAGKIGFSFFVSIGNTIDVDYGHLIDYFGEDENTKSILMYVESITNARKFMTASRAFARTKPIIVYKAGRFPESAAVAASHTGALAAEDDVYNAAFQRTGLARVYDIGEIFDCAELIGRNKIPAGSNLAVVTNAGGPGVMAADALIAQNGSLAKLADETISTLNENLPPMWSRGNPVDVLGDARPKRIAKAVKIVVEDKNVDAVLVILTPQAMTNPTGAAKAIGEIQAQTKKPVLAAWLGGSLMKEGIKLLGDYGVAAYSTPEQAVRAFMTLVEYSRNLETLYETPREIPISFSLNKQYIRDEFNNVAGNKNLLTEEESKKLIAAYGIPVSLPRPALNIDEAVNAANQTGYPVVLKILSQDITHKTDAGGVILNIKNDDQVKEAFAQIIQSAKEKIPGAKIDGVTVQPMITMKNSVELILGIKKDPVFGTVILVGAGGITAELFADRSIGFPPLNERLARRMLEELKIFPLLNGYRGRHPVNLDKLIEVIIRFSYLAADYPEIVELDINPLLVSGDGINALDARIVIDTKTKEIKPNTYSHLALRPYPDEYITNAALEDGTNVLCRPIKPEDEPKWMDLLASCSRESIYNRFRYFFQWASHEVATRYCYIDYDREIAIVAEIEDDKGDKKLVGVGRLIADPEHESVEYAILITDDWQGKDLGNILTQSCIDIAKDWGIKKIVAQTTTDNNRTIAMFKKYGFTLAYDNKTSTVDMEMNI